MYQKAEDLAMAAYHLSGMGLSPGAVTVPLSYVYLLLKAASLGNEDAKKFFATSGEAGQSTKGGPECLILFTSKDVIGGKVNPFEDQWFQSGGEFPKAMWRYLSNLWKALEDEGFRPFYGSDWIKHIYFVEVDHTNFEDCFEKAGTTLYALRKKELWINMIGGSNQTNLALLLAGTLLAVAVRYYYIFQSKISYLHPETEKPDMRNPTDFVKDALRKWYELPVFHLVLGELVSRLYERLSQDGMSEGELEKMLQEMGLDRSWIPKLRGRIINTDGKRVSRGPMLEMMAKLNERIDRNVDNFPKWQEWGKRRGILWEMREGDLVKVQ
jgi:hypothetical protein